jgi:hypothetical protein
MKNQMQNLSKTIQFFVLALASNFVYAQQPSTVIIPRNYICYHTAASISVDGLPTEKDWLNVPWSDNFIDIEGDLKPAPTFKTRMKMLWDDSFLYIAAELEEPHVWANLTERESVIFYDNDFEVFIDPDGDTHNYVEYEMNALNTQWDLLLLKPYRDDLVNNAAIDNWNINGIKSAVHVNGTLNNPNDIDKGWTLEIAIPFDALIELNTTGKLPVQGEQYRVGFSRVEWIVDVVDGKYKKRSHNVNGIKKPLPENNWVWSSQGVIAMHQPETWGFVQFSEKRAGEGSDSYIPDPDNELKWALRQLYFKEKSYFEKNTKYTTDFKLLGLKEILINGKPFLPQIKTTFTMFEAVFQSSDGKSNWHIVEDGRIWKSR